MAVSYSPTEKPAKVSLTGDPIIVQYTVDTDGLNDFRMILEVMLWNGTDYIAISKDTVKADNTSLCTFDIHELLANRIEPTFVYPESKYNEIVVHPELVGKFKLKVSTIGYDDNNNLQSGVGITEADIYYFMEGGQPDVIRQLQSEISSDFYTELITDKRFLTNCPNKKLIHPQQCEKLFWLVRSGCTSLKLNLQVYYLDGTNEAISGTAIAVSEFSITEITATLKYFVPDTALVASYDVWLTDQSSVVISEVRNYILDHDYHERNDFILFRNSLSGYDTAWLNGDRDGNLEGERDHYKKQLPKVRPRLSDRSFTSTRALYAHKFESNTGWISKEYAAYLAELMASDDVIYLYNDQALPVKHLTEDINTGKDKVDTHSVDLEWQLGMGSRYHGTFNKAIKCPLPPYWNDIEACYFKTSGNQLIDIKGGKNATINYDGTITFPTLTNDVFDKGNTTYWEATLGTGRQWDPSDFNNAALVLESHEAVQDLLFWKIDENNSSARYFMPMIVYKSARSDSQKQVIVEYQNAYYFIVDDNGNLIVENGNLLTV